MIIRELRLPDDTGELYAAEAAARQIELPALLVERLEHAQALDPRARFLIVEGRTRERLEETLGGLPLQSTEDLIAKVQRLARIRFGDHEIKLTPGQLEELTWRAKRIGKPIEELILAAYNRFAQDFFTLVP